MGSVAHPAVASKPVISSATSGDTSGIGNPLSLRPDLPGTKALIAEGKKTQQQLGKIQTNTWGTSPFAGYDFGSSEEEDDDDLYDDDDEDDRPKKKKNVSNEPPKSYGQRKYADGNKKPSGFSSSTGVAEVRPVFIETKAISDRNIRVDESTGTRAWSPSNSNSGK